MAAAHTTHGRFSAGGAAARAKERRARHAVVRSDLLSAATMLREYLAPDAEKRLDLGPVELWPPARVGVAMPTPCNSGRGEAGRVTPLMTDWRQAERALAQAEVEALAPWRAAIAAARAKRREIYAARRRPAAAKSHRRQIEAMQREVAAREAAMRRGATREAEAREAAMEPGVAEINPLYPEPAPRAGEVVAPGEINQRERKGAATGDPLAPQASLTERAPRFSEWSRTDPIHRRPRGDGPGG
jgi:hypothetical protein